MSRTWSPLKLRRRMFLTSLLSLLTLCVLMTVSLIFREAAEQAVSPLNDIKCSAIYDMDPVEVGKSLVIRKNLVVDDTDESMVDLTIDCRAFRRARGYDEMCQTQEEEDFPLAFSLVVHKSAAMVERLIRAAYSPSNIYCIHYDQKSPAAFMAAMKGLASCLPNVFIASKLEYVVYGGISRLRADLNCLSDLLASRTPWKYVINLCGQDFPLRSNMELVSELKKLHGSNMLETSRPSEYKKQRFGFRHELQGDELKHNQYLVKTSQQKAAPPHGIEVFVGSAYFVLSRDFVAHINSSVQVADFLLWSEDTYSPDEHFWATLARLPGVPGEVPRTDPDITDMMSQTRLVKWEYLEGSLYPQCTGQHLRSVCIYGAGDLRWLLAQHHWFANKFDPRVDPVVILCLEKKLKESQKLFQSAASPACRGG
ncbi:beta-1,3-galactosyl-O-glycosyl-glycoprotein beta-1,6-N-acetylglucosaminyltransferase 4-like [Synchiropus splendidus]|uniref:beta-1,3-galactosyl-O-glycosyl-glycoprotein beta-1,6-N-acetylglucosaminyltransferase 4-like n=1 Tax=Synchiropus splendidus TaxID=270530 RepID=UPI00237E0B0C|nr:beta-1,3-galactosyl-O-glycosyl-glycoprotein beta-1,6-N-acetylglucosaminyltransferase 4-like [Synchiropus splendidus]